MKPLVFEIINTRRRKANPCGQLIVTGHNEYRIEIDDQASIADVPALFIPFMKKGERIIENKWAARWVEDRVCPSGRQNLAEVLKSHNLREYDVIELLRSSKGRSSQDDFKIIERTAEPEDDSGKNLLRQMVADKLKEQRQALGLSQAYVARKVGISQPAYCNIELGKTNVTIDLLDALFKALTLSVSIIDKETTEQP